MRWKARCASGVRCVRCDFCVLQIHRRIVAVCVEENSCTEVETIVDTRGQRILRVQLYPLQADVEGTGYVQLSGEIFAFGIHRAANSQTSRLRSTAFLFLRVSFGSISRSSDGEVEAEIAERGCHLGVDRKF